ncbi:MAG: ThuA domain-containing protein [Acidobacteriota bacterium]
MRTGLTAIAALLCVVWVVAQQAPPQQGPGGAQPGARGQADGRGRGGGRGGAPRTKKVVLAWADTRNGQAQHDSSTHMLAVLERIGYESGTYDMYIRTDSDIISYNPKKTDGTPASGGPNLNNVDAIFFAGHRNVPLDEAGQKDLIKFIKEDGKGFVAAYIALTPWSTFPEMTKILGATSASVNVHDPFGGTGSVLVNESPDFPAVKHFPGTMATGQAYYQPDAYDRTDIQVLLRKDLSNLSPVASYTRPDGDYPVAWIHNYGKGRVFYSSLGNGQAAEWDDNNLQRMYFEAIKWSLGLTHYDVKPHPLPADARPPQGPPAPAQTAPGRGARQGAPAGAAPTR